MEQDKCGNSRENAFKFQLDRLFHFSFISGDYFPGDYVIFAYVPSSILMKMSKGPSIDRRGPFRGYSTD